MSFSIQTQSATLTEMTLFAAESEETNIQNQVAESLPEEKGALKTEFKRYFLSSSSSNLSQSEKMGKLFNSLNPKSQTKADHLLKSPINFASSQYSKQNSHSTSFTAHKGALSRQETLSHSQPRQQQVFSGKATEQTLFPKGDFPTVNKEGFKNQHLPKNTRTAPHENGKQPQKEGSKTLPFAQRNPTRHETKQWWEERYTQRERQGGGQDRDQRDQSEEEETLRVKRSESASFKGKSSQPLLNSSSFQKNKKPKLTPPKPGVFALYYILTKIGIASDGASNFSYKQEIELVDSQTTTAHQKRLKEMQEALKKEEENARWATATKVFSWIGSIIGVIGGVLLIATGVGAVAGAMLIVGGLIQLTNEILALTGGWHKIAEMLPGDDPEKKRAVLSWIQIGITVLCLILSAAGAIWGGFSNFGRAIQTAMGLFQAVAATGRGITIIGEGLTSFMYYDKLGNVKKYDVKLAKLKHNRQDLLEKVGWGVDRLEQLFEDLARALEFEVEIFRADQLLYR